MKEGLLPDGLDQELILAAKTAQGRAYAPYSKFRVGAAIRTENGQIFSGCNVENASFGATICAERVAITKMVSEGASRPVAVAIYTEAEDLTMPCGLCRQVLAEFATDLRVLLAGPKQTAEVSLAELFPNPFSFTKEA